MILSLFFFFFFLFSTISPPFLLSILYEGYLKNQFAESGATLLKAKTTFHFDSENDSIGPINSPQPGDEMTENRNIR